MKMLNKNGLKYNYVLVNIILNYYMLKLLVFYLIYTFNGIHFKLQIIPSI